MMNSRKRVLIYGWFGEENLGDELILDSLVSLINSYNDNVEINVMASKVPSVKKNHYGLECISTFIEYRPIAAIKMFYYGVFSVCKNIIRNNIVLIASGGALSDWHRGSTVNLFWLIDILKLRKVSVYFLGCGAGPINIDKSFQRFSARLKCAAKITTRDESSYIQLSHLGIKNIIRSKDLVYYYSDAIRKRYMKKEVKRSVGLVIAAVCYESKPIYDAYKRQLELLMKELLKKQYKVYIIPFHYKEDKVFIGQLKYDRDQIHVLYKEGDFYESISYLSECEIIVAVRYHALVLSAIMNKKMIPLVHHPKNGDFVHDFALEKWAEYIGDGKNWDISQIDYKKIVKNISILIEDKEISKQYKKSLEERLKKLDEYREEEKIIRNLFAANER